jgi:hypothetical protein
MSPSAGLAAHPSSRLRLGPTAYKNSQARTAPRSPLSTICKSRRHRVREFVARRKTEFRVSRGWDGVVAVGRTPPANLDGLLVGNSRDS